MKFMKKLGAAALIGTASVALAGCATGLPTNVTRYSAMPIPQGQTFYVVQADGMPAGLEFSRFAAHAAQHLQARGYRLAASPQAADMLVRLDYEIDEGVVQRDVDPFAYGPYGSPFYGGYGSPYGRYGYPYGGFYGDPYYSRYGYWGPRSPFYYGWNDPFWYRSSRLGYGPGAREYVEYRSELTMNIVRRSDNAPLFEGRAQARSHTDNAGVLVPNLIEAMFTGFPGRNGETVRITVPAPTRG